MAFGTTIGQAVIDVVADSSGFERAVSNLGRSSSGALSRATAGLATTAGRVGESIGSALSNGVSRVFRFGLRQLRRLVIGLGAALAGVAAVTISSGFKRFANIEDATRALTIVLGDAAKAAGLLDKVLKVVEGTPFALDQFTQATQVLAAQNIEIAKIPGILTAIGDAAAASGRGAEGVDLVVDALSRMASQSQLSLEPIRNLEELGVPALRILANESGVSAKTMAKEITAGSIDSKKAIDLLVKGIEDGTTGIAGNTAALAGVAKGLGTTVRGAFENMKIAIARAGAAIFAAFNQSAEGGHTLSHILDDIRDTIDIVGKRLAGLANKLVGTKGFDRFVEFFDKLPKRVSRAFDLIDKIGFGPALSRIFGRVNFGKIAQKVIRGITKAFDKLPHKEFGDLVTNFLVRSIEAVADSIDVIVRVVVRVAPKIIEGILEGLLQAAKDNPLNVAGLFLALGLPGIGPVFTGLLSGIFSKLPFGTIIAPLIRGLGAALQKGFALLFGEGAVAALGDKIALFFVNVAASIGPAFEAVSGAIAAAAPAIAVALGVALGVLLHNLIEKFAPGIDVFLEKFGAMLENLRVAIFTFFGTKLPHFFTATIPRVLGIVIRFFAELPGKIERTLGSLAGRLLRVMARAVTGLARGFLSGVTNVYQALNRFKDNVIRNLIGLVGRLIRMGLRLGADIALGIARGIARNIHRIIDAFRRIRDRAFSFLRTAWNWFSPAGVMVDFGRDLALGVALGIEKTLPAVDRSVNKLSDRLVLPKVPLNLAPFVPEVPVGSAFDKRALGRGKTVIFEKGAITTGQTDPEVLARKLAFQLGRESER